jgi:hypothetical protein
MVTYGCVFVNFKEPDGTAHPNCYVCSPRYGVYINSLPNDESDWTYYSL